MIDLTDYDALDGQLLKSITRYPGGNFQNIYAGKVVDEACRIDPKHGDKVAFQRLQELQKQGRIYVKNKQWFPGVPE